MDVDSYQYMRGAIEALLFISDKPVMIEQMKEALQTIETADIRKIIKELKDEYDSQNRGVSIIEIAGGYQTFSNPQYAEYIRNFFKTRVKEKLSRPALEALAIVAYRQPVSRGDIELIRGVNSDGVVTNLLDKGLVKIVGRKDVPGRPFLYGTTKLFLEYFGLKSLKDLPKLEDVTELLSSVDGDVAEGDALFHSNQPLTMEESVVDAGGNQDHVTQSFARETALEEALIGDDSVAHMEEPNELKEAMDSMGKDQEEDSESQGGKEAESQSAQEESTEATPAEAVTVEQPPSEDFQEDAEEEIEKIESS